PRCSANPSGHGAELSQPRLCDKQRLRQGLAAVSMRPAHCRRALAPAVRFCSSFQKCCWPRAAVGAKTSRGGSHMIKRAICAAALLTTCATLAFAQVRDFRPVTDEVLTNPDPADWLMLNRTFDQQRYSPLKEINTSNVGQLRMAWSRGLPAGTQESV